MNKSQRDLTTALSGLAVLLAAFWITPVDAEQTWTWEELYKGGNYIDAGIALKKQLEGGHKSVAALYYYADCLMRTDREAEALPYYKQVYKLSPRSQYGKYALQVLDSRAVQARLKRRSGNEFKIEQIRPSEKQSDTKSPPSAEVTIPDSEIRRKLPPINQTPPTGPSLQDISMWPIGNQAGYYPEASARVEAAQARLEEAQRLLSQAASATGNLSDPARHYGESEAETRARVEAGKQRAETFLKPYNDNVAYYQRQLENEQAILRLCVNARNTWMVTPPGYYYRPY